MKIFSLQYIIVQSLVVVFMASMSSLSAKPKKSLLDNDPEVVYLTEYDTKPIEFLVIDHASAYATKKGKVSRKLGTFKTGSKVQLVEMTEHAYRVSGKGKHGKLTAWVSPKKLASKDPEFIANLKQLYFRQMEVKKLVANNEVAIGMTIAEVMQSLGSPTKKESKVTKEGRSGSWQFIEYEEIKHYRRVVDPYSGRVFKKLSHITKEEKANLTVEFENDIVKAVTSKEDNGARDFQIVNPPIHFIF